MPQTVTREEWAERTEHARRLARRRLAADRIAKIADGTPRFTAEDLLELAKILLSRAAEREDAA